MSSPSRERTQLTLHYIRGCPYWNHLCGWLHSPNYGLALHYIRGCPYWNQCFVANNAEAVCICFHYITFGGAPTETQALNSTEFVFHKHITLHSGVPLLKLHLLEMIWMVLWTLHYIRGCPYWNDFLPVTCYCVLTFNITLHSGVPLLKLCQSMNPHDSAIRILFGFFCHLEGVARNKWEFFAPAGAVVSFWSSAGFFGHGAEAPSYDEETPQPCFAKNRAERKRFKRSTPSGALKKFNIRQWRIFFLGQEICVLCYEGIFA